MSAAFHELRVSRVIRETADASSFELAVPPALRDAYRYKAGQHLTFRFPWKDLTLTRCYSLASAPEVDDALKIGVKRVDGGRISNWMNDRLQVGDTVMASVPEGRFVLDPETRSSSPLFLFAGGSGITPVISILKSALVTTNRPITLLYANRNAESVIYREELARLAHANPDRLRVRHHYDTEGGYLSRDAVRTLLHDVDVAEFYICGPEVFMQLVETAAAEAGAHPELVYVERFVSPVDPDRAPRETVEAATFEAPPSFSLWLNGRSRTIPYVKGKTLLECAQAAGWNPPHSCESGFCGSCMAHVKTGKVHMRTHEALSERGIAAGVALLCQSVPASSEPLELDSDSTSFRKATAVKSSYGARASRLAAAALFALMIAGALILQWTGP